MPSPVKPNHGRRITHGLAREVSHSLGQCELMHLPREAIDPELAARQHRQYLEALGRAGVEVTVLPEEPTLPDATFIEDTVVILDELAVLCRPGAASRRREVDSIEAAITALRPLVRIGQTGTLDGGDVLQIGRALFVGLSRRTNSEGIRQLEQALKPWDYRVIRVPLKDCLHLKSAVTSPAAGLLLANPDWIDSTVFEGLTLLRVPEQEPWGANTLSVNGTVMIPARFYRTAELLSSLGLSVTPVDVSELQKAEAGVTCLSVLYRCEPPAAPDC